MKKLFKWWFSKLKSKREAGPLAYKFNIKPDLLDVRDYTKALGLVPLPKSVDYSNLVTVKNQGTIGSCGSHAAATGLEMLDKLWNKKPIELSELYHYYEVRQPAFFNSFPADSGQDGRSAMKVMNQIGICPEMLDPYVTANFNKKPGVFCDSFAKWWQTSIYERCYSIDAIKTALSNKEAVWLGIPVGKSIISNKGAIIHFNPKEAIIGGHAMAVVGYDDDKQALKVVNSWGPIWGSAGFGWIAYDYLNLCPWYDSWAFSI